MTQISRRALTCAAPVIICNTTAGLWVFGGELSLHGLPGRTGGDDEGGTGGHPGGPAVMSGTVWLAWLRDTRNGTAASPERRLCVGGSGGGGLRGTGGR